MNLIDFASKTQIMQRVNRTVPGFWPVAVDFGFSAVKGFAPNKVFTFPNCAYQIPGGKMNFIGEAGDSDIVLVDNSGTWVIGELALEMMNEESSTNYESELYGRNRYYSPSFQALIKAGLAIALSRNSLSGYTYGEDTIVVQTGLPPKYLISDSEDLKEVIAGDYDFEIKLGKAGFLRYIFSIQKENIYIMDQPNGSLFSAVTDRNGMIVKEQKKILTQKTVVVDPGFKTLDVYDIAGKTINGVPKTFENLGMHEVFRRTVEKLNAEHGTFLTISGMQRAIKDGYAASFKRVNGRPQTTHIPLADTVESCCQEVCQNAITELLGAYNDFKYHNNLIITGGTGNAWYDIIKEQLSGMETLSIISANRNEQMLSNVYSNVRGYYFARVRELAIQERKKKNAPAPNPAS